MKQDHYLISHTKINTKWTKALNVRPETIKLLEGNIGCKLLNIGLGKDVFNLTPKAKATRTKISKWDYINKKSTFIAALLTIAKIWKQYVSINR